MESRSFSNPNFFEPPGNSNQKSFPQLNTVILPPISRTIRFFEPIFVSLRGSKNLKLGFFVVSASMVGHSFQNYDRVYAGFSAAYTCLHTLRMGFKLIYTTI